MPRMDYGSVLSHPDVELLSPPKAGTRDVALGAYLPQPPISSPASNASEYAAKIFVMPRTASSALCGEAFTIDLRVVDAMRFTCRRYRVCRLLRIRRGVCVPRFNLLLSAGLRQ